MRSQVKLMSILMIAGLLAITACGNDGDGGGSTVTIPDAPGAAVVTPGNSQLTLQWTAVSGATAYEVWYSVTNDSAAAAQDGGDITGTTHTITGLANGTTYYVWLKAKNSAGTSGFGAVASGTPAVTFENADTPGDLVSITVGSETVDMIYANNQTSITFPFSPEGANPVDDEKATLTRKFFMSETQVTNSLFAVILQWAYENGKIVETGGAHNEVSETSVKYGGQELIDLDYGVAYMKISYNESTDTFSVATGYEDHPVVCVSWYGAIMFCNWLTEMRDGNTTNLVYTGIDTTWLDTETDEDTSKTGYRLPSSEEWEYAARYIGTTAPTVENLATEYIAQSHNGGHADLTAGYYWTPAAYASGAIKDYTNVAETRAVAWYSGDPDMGGDKLMPVAQKIANQLGLYDMSGNVWEWCFTAYGSYRVIRGSSWVNFAVSMQVGHVGYNYPDVEFYGIGFRFARTQ